MKTILVVEDDPLLGLDLAEQLREAGYEVNGPAMRASEGLDLFRQRGCHAAVLDVNLGRETSEPVAHALATRGVPFITVSGYASDQHPAVFRGAPFLTKPIRVELLLAELRRMTGPQ